MDHDSSKTSIHVRRAATGDLASLDFVVRRFSPVLVAQAAWRLGPRLRRFYDPEDLVADAWMLALPRLPELPERDGRMTPVLLRFLSTAIVNRVNNLVKRHLRAGVHERLAVNSRAVPDDATVTGVVTAAIRVERGEALGNALDELDPTDREIILLRGIEQRANVAVAELLELTEAATAMRFHRALARLRAALPDSLFDDLT